MKHLSNFKIYEKMGDSLPKDDIDLQLLKDLSLDLMDDGFEVIVKGYEAYNKGYDCFDIIIEMNNSIGIVDVNSTNFNDKFKKIDNNIKKIDNLNAKIKPIIEQALKVGLYLCSYNISNSSATLHGFIKFYRNQDHSPVTDFIYSKRG